MRFYSLKLNLQSAPQAEVIQTIKNAGGDAIQASDGLHVKIDHSRDELKELLTSKNVDAGISISEIDEQQTLKADDAAPDLKEFISN